MYYNRLFTFIILFLCAFGAKAAVFTVTSNADSGPGTLREALTLAAANGGAEKDFIYFNLPDLSEAGRTIRLIQFLPELSPNLTIDGITQPGNAFGISEAKIKIALPDGLLSETEKYHILYGSNLGDVSISGLWVWSEFYYYMSAKIIDITSSKHVEITKNLIQGGRIYIELTDEVRLQNNVAGFMPDGITSFQSSIELVDIKNSIIGGSAETGNLVSESIDIKSYTLTVPWGYDISFNKVGVDYTGASSSPNLYTGKRRISASIQNTVAFAGTITGTIRENVAGNNSSVVIYASGNGTVEISGNSIGIDKSHQIAFQDFYPDYVKSNPPATTGIVIESGMKAVIRRNTIAYVANGILEQFAKEVTIESNDIYCLTKNNFNIHGFLQGNPVVSVKITGITATAISGTATPGATVELFKNDKGNCASCGASCSFATAIADAQGSWSYATTYGKSVTASAIYNNQTSYFTVPEVNVSNIVVTQMDCDGALGKITGATFYNAATVHWINEIG